MFKLSKNSFILHIPHSNKEIPTLDGYIGDYKKEVLKLTDWATDRIFDVNNFEKVIFKYNRVFCDVERFSDDSKEEMAKYGMGFFYTHTDNGSILRENIGNIKERIFKKYYLPHHKKLNDLTISKLNKYKKVIIIDCHSFSNEPFLRDLDKQLPRPDICIGTDIFHTPKDLEECAVNYFTKHNFIVKVNSPYSGSLVPIDFYGKDKNVLSIMIEINRKLYMQKDDIIIEEKVDKLNEIIKEFLESALVLHGI